MCLRYLEELNAMTARLSFFEAFSIYSVMWTPTHWTISCGLLEALSHCLLPQQCHHRSILIVSFSSFHHKAAFVTCQCSSVVSGVSNIPYLFSFHGCNMTAKSSVRTKKYLIIWWQLLRSIYWCRHQRSTCHLWTSWEKKLLWVRYHKN